MNIGEAAPKLGVDSAALCPASAEPRFTEVWERMQQEPPCSACGQPLRTTGVVRDRVHGPRWFDRCRDSFLATPPILRRPLSQAITDIREAAAEVGLRTVLYTDEDGWQDELRGSICRSARQPNRNGGIFRRLPRDRPKSPRDRRCRSSVRPGACEPRSRFQRPPHGRFGIRSGSMPVEGGDTRMAAGDDLTIGAGTFRSLPSTKGEAWRTS
ncbi:hypothetical protein [Streptomyces coeruleorubidus]|uniref:hypothetical protein n=1 Tax=Streptomyces coeruleorubidus TaxID=116188 RepID=UPI0037B5E8D2